MRVGMTREDVRGLFGEPDRIGVTSNLETWDYGLGKVTFVDGTVWEWLKPEAQK